jgi:Trk K+ transport system NAD-binding subunit
VAAPENRLRTVEADVSWEQAAGHLIVCGLGDDGLRIVEQLHAAGERVVVVDDAPDARLLRIAAGLGVAHLSGSGQRTTTLYAAGLAGAAALVCVDPDDLRNLEIALLARRLRPDVRLVVQLKNQAVAKGVERVTGAGSVLDVATLAAPAFVEACLGRRRHQLDLGGELVQVVDVAAERAGPLRVLFGDLAPVAVVPAAGGPVQICPGRDLIVEPGDRVIVIGTESDLASRRIHPVDEQQVEPGHRQRRRLTVAWRYITGFASETERSLRVTLLVLLGLAVLSAALIAVNYRGPAGRRIGLLDSLYSTVQTLTTVGFGDFAFGGQSAWLRVWAIVLMILGATLVTVVYALLTNLLVSRRIEQSLGRQLVTRMRDHVVLVGLGSVGLRVLETLVAMGEQVVVLERDEHNRYLTNARALEVPVVIGDSTTPGNLAAVNVSSAKAVAVLTSSDLANIETGLAVDGILGERRDRIPVVMRVFDRQLAQTIEASFGFRHVRSTSALAAPWFVGAALGLDVQSTFYIAGQPMLVGRLTVSTAGGLQGRTMLDLSARIRVIAIVRLSEGGRLEYPPRRDTRFRGGDQAYLIGPYEELLAVLRRDQYS